MHIASAEASAHDRIINFRIIKFYRILIESISSCRDIPQVVGASGLRRESRHHHIIVIARLTWNNAT